MTKDFWTLTEVMEIFEVQEGFILDLEEEELLCPICREESPTKVFSAREVDKLRLAKILMDEMGVNLPGVEVILRMRETLFDMRRQFDDILEDLARQVQERLK